MKAEGKRKRIYNETKGDNIIPGEPKLDEKKKDVYPVFQWVCSYQIQTKGENSSGFNQNKPIVDDIDLDLEPYCKKRAREDGKKRVKPTHHNYNNPYSLYCANPHSERK